jgi:hypothetical protein
MVRLRITTTMNPILSVLALAEQFSTAANIAPLLGVCTLKKELATAMVSAFDCADVSEIHSLKLIHIITWIQIELDTPFQNEFLSLSERIFHIYALYHLYQCHAPVVI